MSMQEQLGKLAQGHECVVTHRVGGHDGVEEIGAEVALHA